MKYIILATLLLGCVTSQDKATEANTTPNIEVDTIPKKGTIPITYHISKRDLNVTFCKPDGNLGVVYGTIGFDTTMFFNSGDMVCLAAEERRIVYTSLIVTIKRDSVTIFSHKGDDKASVSGYLE